MSTTDNPASSAMNSPATDENGIDRQLELITEALLDERWDFRTIDGIAKATGLPEEAVRNLLETRQDLFRKSAVPDRNRQILYTLQSRPAGISEILANVRAFVTKST